MQEYHIHTSHDKIAIMLRDVMIIDENVENIKIILIFLTHHQVQNRVSILDRWVNILTPFRYTVTLQILVSIAFLINNINPLQNTQR